MAYLSLYLKYRPTTFEGILGQQHVARTLQNAVAGGRVAHAYLFTGPRGTGKTTAARILARALNCEKGPTPQPCGECPACRRIMQDACLDVVEVDAASRRRVEETSELLSTVDYLPAEVRNKVYVIDEVHMLSAHAFNSLLKTLEEPPGHVVFVLATTEVHKVPATIISRCQRFDFRRIGFGDLIGLMREIAKQEGIEVEEEALGFLAEEADGSARDGISLLEQAASYGGNKVSINDVIFIAGVTEEKVLGEFVALAAKGDICGGLDWVEQQMLLGKDVALLLRDLTEYLRDCLVVRLGGKPRRYLKGTGEELALDSVSRETLMDLIEVAGKTGEELRWSAQHRLLCELAFIKMSEALSRKTNGAAGGSEPAEVKKVEEMEKEDGGNGVQEWGKVVEAMESDKAIPLVQLVQGSEALLEEGRNLLLSFDYEFNKREFERRLREDIESRTYLEGLLLKTFGRQVSVECRMRGEGESGRGNESAVVARVRAIFPESRVVERG